VGTESFIAAVASASGGVSLELFCELFFTVKQSQAHRSNYTQHYVHCCVSLTKGGICGASSFHWKWEPIIALKDFAQLLLLAGRDKISQRGFCISLKAPPLCE
jgi:hypothetical protein